METPKVLIVGAGPVGLTAAANLARLNVPFRIIDKTNEPSPEKISKALVIHARTLELLEDLGITDQILEKGLKITSSEFVDAQGPFFRLDINLDDFTQFGYMLCIPQGATERILIKHLSDLGINVERGLGLKSFTQNENGVDATLENVNTGAQETAHFEYLIGCDGAHSTVRHTLNLKFEGMQYPQSLYLCDAVVEGVNHDGFAAYTSEAYVAVFVPLPAPNYFRLIVDDLKASEAQKNSTDFIHGAIDTPLSLEQVQGAIDTFQKGIKLSQPGWLSYFRVSHRLVEAYRVKRVFLSGDAAHIHSPIGGQGMNTGMQDALNITWKLAAVIHGSSPLSILDSYQLERRQVAQNVLGGTDTLMKLMALKSPFQVAIRNKLMNFVSNFQTVQTAAGNSVSELNVSYKKSNSLILWDPSSTRLGSYAYVPPGDRVPDFILSNESRFYQLLRTKRRTPSSFYLVLFLNGNLKSPSSLIYKDAERFTLQVNHRYDRHVTVLLVLPDQVEKSEFEKSRFVKSPIELYFDKDNKVRDVFDVQHSHDSIVSYVFRPDLYVGYFGHPFNEDQILEYLERVLV